MPARILLIDDEPDVATSLRDLLLTLGGPPVVALAATVREGEFQVEFAGPLDMVIADHRLPDGEGVALLRKVLDRRPATRRVLMTAYSDPEISVRAINEAHVDYFLQKPWDAALVGARVGQLLRSARAPGSGEGRGRIPPFHRR